MDPPISLPALDKATEGLSSLYDAADELATRFSTMLGGNGRLGGAGSIGDSARSFFKGGKGKGSSGGGFFNGFFSDLIGGGSGDDDIGGANLRSLGGNAGGKMSKTTAADVQQYNKIAAYLKKQGISEAASFGSAAGAIAESHGSATAYNKSSGAFGIGQWLGARKKMLFARYGQGKRLPTEAEQLEFLAWELKGGDYGGKKVLNSATVQEALHAYVYKFMRPAGSSGVDYAGSEAQGDMRRGSNVIRAANVNVNVKVQNQPGAHAAVSANAAAGKH